jgi:hypothetical protein
MVSMHIIKPGIFDCKPATPKGSAKPAAEQKLVHSEPFSLSRETLTAETPVPKPEEPRQGIEGDVGSRALGVVIWA